MPDCGNNNNNASGGSQTGGAILNFLTKITSEEVAECSSLKNPSRHAFQFLLGMMLIVLASSMSVTYLTHGSRLQSFGTSVDEAVANHWAMNGFHSDGLGGASCFHCGAHSGQVVMTMKKPDEVHVEHCALKQLLRYLTRSEWLTDAQVAAEADRLQKKILTLTQLLSSRLVGMVESYGFSKDQISLALIRRFFSLSNQVDAELRPGDLIEILHQVPTELIAFVKELLPIDGTLVTMLQNYVHENFDPTVFRSTRTANEATSSTNNNMQSSAVNAENNIRDANTLDPDERPQLTDDDSTPMCLKCRSHPRDRVLLPCAHLKFCKACAAVMQQCGFCGRDSLCALPAYTV